ncbi:hypothetical protein [Candidatus Villigracilis affinis]|uniref:hypothetical protein n=1 Tax=Candidatus Villigracilis affinis TaxID=3140682 RepID=UPI001D9EC94A|nr:hypothetical protein [Anaerolineales bacterium]
MCLKLDTIDYLVSMSDPRWEIVQSESLRVLEQVMRRAIYEDKVESTQAGIPSIVSLTLNEQPSALVAELARALVLPNSFFSEERTAAQQSARCGEADRPTYKSGNNCARG